MRWQMAAESANATDELFFEISEEQLIATGVSSATNFYDLDPAVSCWSSTPYVYSLWDGIGSTDGYAFLGFIFALVGAFVLAFAVRYEALKPEGTKAKEAYELVLLIVKVRRLHTIRLYWYAQSVAHS